MPTHLSKRIKVCLIAIAILVTCCGCKASFAYTVEDYLNYLAVESGIGDKTDINENFNKLKKWGIVDALDKDNLNNPLDYYYLTKTISRLINEENDYLVSIKNMGWIDINVNGSNLVQKDEAERIVECAVDFINNGHIESIYEYEFKKEIKNKEDDLKIGDIVYDQDNDKYIVVEDIKDNEIVYKDASFDEVFENVNLADSFEIDFNECEVIPYLYDNEVTNYVNTKYNLLAAKNENHVFNHDGFRISYQVNTTGITVHVSKDVNKINMYCDLLINKIRPSFKYTTKDEEIKNCFFKIDFTTSEKLGASIGRYKNYHIDFNDLDSTSFISKLNSIVKKNNDEVETTLKICQIKTPVPNIPTAYLNMDVLLKIYVSGKVELTCDTTNSVGFEIKEGNFRTINDSTCDINAIASASGKACAGLNFNLEAVNTRLADIELDAGVKGEVKSTLHLYDDNGEAFPLEYDLAYDSLEKISEGNENVKVCGDVSLYWLMNILINTPKTKLSKIGFSKTIEILDEKNQIFNNLHHIENGMFVEKCTRTNKSKTKVKSKSSDVNKIILESYAKIIDIDTPCEIGIVDIPNGYQLSDINYDSDDNSIVSITNGLLYGIKEGVTKVRVYTTDNKYECYLSVLVSKP